MRMDVDFLALPTTGSHDKGYAGLGWPRTERGRRLPARPAGIARPRDEPGQASRFR
jgi:hypothetical protein